jgi:hypothetical protein
MGHVCKIDRYVDFPTLDAAEMAALVMQFAPANETEALKLLRANFSNSPLSMRVAALDMLMRGWPRKLNARHSPR